MSTTKVKEYISDYNSIASRFIQDENLSLEIQQNISFVENYIDKVEEAFDEKVEREIAYRELGVIVFSCIEALLQSVLFEINERCKKNKLKNTQCAFNKCVYRKCLNYLSNKGKYHLISNTDEIKIIDALIHLVNTRLFMLFPEEIDELTKMNAKRNYVHISKKIGQKNLDIEFNKDYPLILLSYYYKLLDQLDLCDFYFDEDDICLKELDSDGFCDTSKMHEIDKNYYYLKNFDNVIWKVFHKERLSKNDKQDLKRYNELDEVRQEMALRSTTMVLRPILQKNIDGEEYVKIRNKTLDILSKCVSKKFANNINKEI